MEVLQDMVASLTKDEVRHFKLLIGPFGAPDDRKDFQLFDYFRTRGDKANEDTIARRLYPTGDKNAYYRLKNRLLGDVARSQLHLHALRDKALEAPAALMMGRLAMSRNQGGVAAHFLKRAERKALQHEDFELLDVIYSELIRLSNERPDLDPEQYITRRRQNLERLTRLREIDDVLSIISYRLRSSQNYTATNGSVVLLLERILDDVTQNTDLRRSPKLRIQIYRAVSRLLLQKHDYPALEDYLLRTYEDFLTDGLFTREQHSLKLSMLTYLINTLFKNKKYEASLGYTHQLGEAMEAYDRMFYDKYLIFYYNALLINYYVLDLDRAIDLLTDLKENETLKAQPHYEIFVIYNFATCWLKKGNYKRAIRELTQLTIHQAYKTLDKTLRLKMAMAELLVRYELADSELFDRRAEQIRRDFGLEIETSPRDQRFFDLIRVLNHHTQHQRWPEALARIDAFLAEGADEDTDVVKYNDWLHQKRRQLAALLPATDANTNANTEPVAPLEPKAS